MEDVGGITSGVDEMAVAVLVVTTPRQGKLVGGSGEVVEMAVAVMAVLEGIPACFQV